MPGPPASAVGTRRTCSAARRRGNKGTCNNRVNIRHDALAPSVLNGLRTHLIKPELFKQFCEEFTQEVNRMRIERRTDQDAGQSELERVKKQI